MTGHAHIEHSGDNKRVALLIAVLALCLSLAQTGANSAQTNVITQNVEATDLWSFFQARTIRQTTVSTAAEQAELQKLGTADPGTRKAIETQQKAWQDTAARWESEPETGEGRKELSSRARDAEIKREHSMAQYHLFEYASALFEIAIVIASASIVTGVPVLAGLGVLLGIGGLGLSAIGIWAPQAVHLM
jgi:hypothetical protein